MRGSLLARASLRFYRQHPAQLLLTLLGVALGAAVVVAVGLANRAALLSFDRSIAALAGPMSHEIVPRSGATLDETLYRDLRLAPGRRDMLPLVELSVTIAGRRERLLGIDPLALPADRLPAGVAQGAVFTRLLLEADAAIVPAALAARLDLAPGDALAVSAGDREARLRVAAIGAAGAGGWLADMLLADIAVVQHLAARRGRLDRVLLRLDAGAAKALRERLPPSAELREFDARRGSFAAMTRAFRINLTAMSLLALLVGAFLVYNAMSFAVVQRRAVFATLRLLGVTAAQLRRRLLLEAALLGLAGAALGTVLGVVLGQSLLLLVTRTVSDLYVQVAPLRPDLPPLQLLAACAATLAAVLLATLAPARAAARVAPAGLMHEPRGERHRSRGRWAALGTVLMLACPLLIAVSGRSLLAGFAALFLLLVGYSLLLPLLLTLLLRAAQALLPATAPLRALVLRGVERALPRLGPAIIALSVAVAATVGVAIMIDSFRSSVAGWLETTLRGDVYVYAEGDGETLETAWSGRLAALPGVRSVTAGRLRELQLGGERTRVLVLDNAPAAARGFELLQGAQEALPAVLGAGAGVLVSEPLARRRGLTAGSTLALATPAGSRELPVLGVYRDYGDSRGGALMGYTLYARYWDDTAISTLSLQLAPGADAGRLQAAIAGLAARHDRALATRSAAAIRERSMAIFDRTFAVTDVLRVLVVIVAFVGIVSALLALFLERRQEFALLRATGMTPAQLLRLLLGQAGLSGLLAGCFALPLGMLLSILLIDVINRRSFGWSLQTQFDPLLLLQAVALATAAALLAALWPARRLAGAALRAPLQDP